MVVLEGSGGVVTIGNNQYLQPDYLTPLSTTMDTKKSPLALLAQTCSQIGADSSAVKPLLSLDKNKKSNSASSASSASSAASSVSSDSGSAKSPMQAKSPKSTTPTTTEVKLAFKPYEANVLSHQNQNTFKSSPLPPPATNNTSANEDVTTPQPQQQHQQQQQLQQHHQQQLQLHPQPQPQLQSQQSSHPLQHVPTPQQRPSSKASSSLSAEAIRVPSRSKPENGTPDPILSKTHDLSSLAPTSQQQQQHDNNNRKTVSPSGSSQRGNSPIIRSGMEVLNNANGSAQHPKEMSSMAAAAAAAAAAYKAAGAPYGLNPLSALCCPPGMEAHAAAANPAFRPPFATTGFSHHHAAMLAAAAAGGYPGAASTAAGAAPPPNPYITYQRIKTPTGGEAIVPVCKDPYCPGCPYSAHTQQMLMGTPCPAGCTQCEHQKYGMAAMMSTGGAGLPPGHPYSQAAAAAAAAARSAPYVCSWVVGDAYCGKRFQTSDELFTHLRTHTGNLSDPAAAAAALAQSQAQSLLGSLFPTSALRAGYPTPPLSPMSAAAAAAAAARYHPYAKPASALAAGAPPTHFVPPPGTFNPAAAAAAAAALGPYYSPYAMYGQRIGSAAVHQ